MANSFKPSKRLVYSRAMWCVLRCLGIALVRVGIALVRAGVVFTRHGEALAERVAQALALRARSLCLDSPSSQNGD
jgi:hypothetical protein